MATVRTPPGGGVDQALLNWQSYKQQALYDLAQMKGHIAAADKLRVDQKAAERVRELEQELAVGRAWRAQLELDLQTAQQERDQSRIAAKEWEAAAGESAVEARATREEACNSARECAELVLQVRTLEEQLQKQRQGHREQIEAQVEAMRTLFAAANSGDHDGEALLSGTVSGRRKPWDSPASAMNANTGAEGTVSVADLASRITALRDERDSAQATCESLRKEQRSYTDTIQLLREANEKASRMAKEREREQSLAAVAAAVAVERQQHAAAQTEREAQWKQEQQAWSDENEGLRAQLAELQVQTTGLRAALAAKKNEITGTKNDLGRQLGEAEIVARAAESAARVAEEEAEELRLELRGFRAAQDRATSLQGELEREEKKRKAAEAEMFALRAELDSVVRENAELAEANRVVESKLSAGRDAVAAAVAEADTLRSEWEEERVVVQQTMKDAEQRLQQQAMTLTAVAAVSPAASAAIKRVQQQQQQSGQRDFSDHRSTRVGPPTPKSPVRQFTEPLHPSRETPTRTRHSEQASRRGSIALRVTTPEATRQRQATEQRQSQRGQGRRSSTPGQAKNAARERGAEYARQVEERDEMLRQISDVAGREFVRRNGLATAPIARVQEVLHSARLQALSHVRTMAGKQVAHALAFAPVEEIETATLSMLGTPAQPLQGRRTQDYNQPAGMGMQLNFAHASATKHETV